MKPLTARAMAKLLDENGWTFVSQSGSHMKFRNVINGKVVIVPDHGSRDLTPGTQRRIMRDAGLTHDDLNPTL